MPGTPIVTYGTRMPRPNDVLTYQQGRWLPVPTQNTPVKPTLPVNALNDDEFVYKAGTGVYWNFKYEAATGYWNFIGGPPYTAIVAGTISNSIANTWQDTVNPQATAAFAGDYIVQSDALLASGGAALVVELSAIVNGAAAFPSGINWFVDTAFPASVTKSAIIVQNLAVPAGGVISQEILASIAGAGVGWSFRTLRVTPIRIH